MQQWQHCRRSLSTKVSLLNSRKHCGKGEIAYNEHTFFSPRFSRSSAADASECIYLLVKVKHCKRIYINFWWSLCIAIILLYAWILHLYLHKAHFESTIIILVMGRGNSQYLIVLKFQKRIIIVHYSMQKVSKTVFW